VINLPLAPFKYQYFDDDDPFVKEAKRKRQPSEACWCGSGRLYKECHIKRHTLKAHPLGRIRKEILKLFKKNRGCMHPNASLSSCKGPPIASHVIQKKGPLAALINDSKHICHIKQSQNGNSHSVENIGWKKASISPLYCARHDAELFRKLETEAFIGTHEQCVLQSFRSVCCELYKKKALVESLKYQRDVLDRERSKDKQIEIQYSINKNINGQMKSIEELKALADIFNEAIKNENLDLFKSKTYPFQGPVGLISAATTQAEFDFNGLKLADLDNLNQDAESLVYSIFPSDVGGSIVFCWPTDFKSAAAVVASFDRLSADDKGDIFAQYCFLISEETYFSEQWWNSLSSTNHDRVFKLSESMYYEGGKFEANPDPLVSWKF
jgi:hypothetical protein